MRRGLYIDPGTTESGYIVFDGEKCWERGIIPNLELLDLIPCACQDVQMEMIASYGMPVGKETFETCVWIGRFIERAHAHGIYAGRVFRGAIKLHLCQSPRAKDSNIMQALQDRFGKPGSKKNGYNEVYQDDRYSKISGHMWSALALAVYHKDILNRHTNGVSGFHQEQTKGAHQ